MLYDDFHRTARIAIRKRRYERADFVRRKYCIHYAPVVRAQHATVIGQPDVRRFLAEPVDDTRGMRAPPRIVAVQTNATDVVVSFVHLCKELPDLFGRILE